MQLRAPVDMATAESHICVPECMSDAPLAQAEAAHWLDFVADEAHPAVARTIFYGPIFRGFRWLLLVGAPSVPTLAVPEAVPPPRLTNLRQKTELFDRLAGYYGDRYRGGVILIYFLGCAAVITALSAAILPQTAYGRDLPDISVWWLIIELTLLTLIVIIHMRGRSVSPGARIPSGPRFMTQRWHERWIDYRGLAERFRYAELQIGMPATTEPSAADDWCTRYLKEEFARTAATTGTVTHRARILRAAIDEQQRYHQSNAHISEVLSRRLHRITVLLFFGAVAALCVELAESLSCGAALFAEQYPGICSNYKAHFWLYFSAGFPACAAALHGIESGCEWSKLARSSKAIARALDELRTKLEALLRPGHEMAGQDDALDSLTARFVQVTTDELTGWRATLWDKNVPLVV